MIYNSTFKNLELQIASWIFDKNSNDASQIISPGEDD